MSTNLLFLKSVEPSPLERIFTTPGLQHIAIEIFGHLRVKDLINCKKVNENWKDLVEKTRVYYCETLPAFEKRQATLRKSRLEDPNNYTIKGQNK